MGPGSENQELREAEALKTWGGEMPEGNRRSPVIWQGEPVNSKPHGAESATWMKRGE